MSKKGKEEAEKITRRTREAAVSSRRATRFVEVATVLVVLVMAAVTTIVVLRSPHGSPSATSSDVPTGAVDTPTAVDEHGAFRVGAGGAVVAPGSAPDGGVRVDLFFDPMCPGCGATDRALSGRFVELLDSHQIDLYMTPVAFLDANSSDGYSSRTVSAIATVADEDPTHFMAFVSALYKVGTQPDEGGGYRSVSDVHLAGTAESVGVPAEVADTFSKEQFVPWAKKQTAVQTSRTDLFPQGFSTPGLFTGVSYVGSKASGQRVDLTGSDSTVDTFNAAVAKAASKRTPA